MYGWMNYDGLTYHMNEETGILDSGVTEVDGKHYFFGIKYNKLMYGLITDYDGDKYYTNNKGELQSGFHEIDGKVYYFDSKTYKALSGWQEIDGAKYYFDPITKVRAKGVTEVNGKYYFIGINSGKLMYGWINDSGTKYYSNETTGELVTGWLTQDGAKYYFDPNTKICASDVTEIDGKKYFFGIKYNKLMHGWVTYEDRTYYGDLTTGELLSDWQIIDGTKYFFGLTKNKLYKGWLLYPKDNKMYYLDPVTGIAVTGWKEIGGYMYYFDENSTYVTGNKTIDGMDYYFYEDGKMKSNFVTIDGKTYYYYNNGKKADDWTSIAGKKYFFNSLGVMIAKDAKKVIDVSSHQGTIDWDTVKAQGNVDGIILRISAGSAYEDTQLKRNVSELNRLGIPYGVYIYSYAEDMISTVSDLGTMHEGALEGARVVNAIKKYNMKLSLPIYYDLEVWENGKNRLWNPTMYTTIVKEFDKVLTSNGYTNWQIYTNKHWADTALNTPYLTERITWIAQYNHYCTYTGKYDMWQYSSTESIPGIKGNVDVNVLF